MKKCIYILVLLLICSLVNAANIIITPDSLYGKAVELSNFHNNKSISSQVVNVSEIWEGYDDNMTIGVDGADTKTVPYNYNKSLAKKIIRYLQTNSFDKIIIFGDSSLIPPSYYVYDENGIDTMDKWIPTDIFYSSPDLDIDVDVPFGRIPVKNTKGADNYLNKLSSWYSSNGINNVVLAGGDPADDNNYYGELIVSEVASELAGKNITKLYSTAGSFKKSNLTSSFDADLLYLVGHGNFDSISLDDGVFEVSDINSLSQSSYPIILSSLCSNGAFDTSLTGQSRSIGEAIVTKPKGGVAFIGSSRLSYGLPIISYEDGEISIAETRYSSELMKNIIENYKSGGKHLGGITKKALNNYITNHNMSNNLDKRTVFGFTLLGDPSMKLPSYVQESYYTKPDLTALNPTTAAAIPHYNVRAGNPVTVNISTDSPQLNVKLLKDSLLVDSYVNPGNYLFYPTSAGLYYMVAEGDDSQETRMVINVSMDESYDTSSFIIPASVDFPESGRNVIVSKQINVINNGNKKLTNITILTDASLVYNLTAEPSSFDLDINESKLITITSFIPLYTDSGISKIGALTFKSEEFSKSINLNLNAENKIEITGIKAYVDGKKRTVSAEDTIVDTEPGSNFSVWVNVKNLFEDLDIDTAVIIVNISSIEYNAGKDEYKDIVKDTDSFFIKKSRENDATVKIGLPEVVNSGLYYVYLLVEADDDNGAMHTASSRFLIDIEKEDYKIAIIKLELWYESINCDGFTEIYTDIANMGEKDTDVLLSITNSELGINIKKEVFLASEIDSELNVYSETLEINGENLESGEYPITVTVERDGRLEDSRTATLTVTECLKEVKKGLTETEILAQQNIEQLNQQAFTSSKSFKQSSTYKMLIAIIIVLWAGLIVFVIGALIIVAGKRKR